MKTLAFALKTVPDTDAGRSLHNMEGLPDEDVARVMLHLNMQNSGDSFLPPHLLRIVAIAFLLSCDDELKLASVGKEVSLERELALEFASLVARHKPRLISWNANSFAFPVLRHRSLFLNVEARAFWQECGSESHLDLAELLSGRNRDNTASLYEVSTIMRLPGQMSAEQNVYELWKNGEIKKIRGCCEAEALNTWLLYLRYERVCGNLKESEYDALISRL